MPKDDDDIRGAIDGAHQYDGRGVGVFDAEGVPFGAWVNRCRLYLQRGADAWRPDWGLGPHHPDATCPPAALRVADQIADASQLTPIMWQGLAVPPRRWLVPDVIPLRHVTLLYGDGGLGKSLLGLQLATACATQRKWLGMDTMRCAALVILCEDEEDEAHRRQDAINRHYGIEHEDLDWLNVDSRPGLENRLWTEQDGLTDLYGALRTRLLRDGQRLLVLDSRHDVFKGRIFDETSAHEFVNELRRLAMAIDGAVVLIGHPSQAGMNSGEGTAGNTAWNNVARSRLYLHRDGSDDSDPDARILSTKKANYAAGDGRWRLRWHEGVLSRDDPPSGAVAAIQKGQHERLFLDLLDKLTTQGRPPSHAKNGGKYAPKIMASMDGINGAKLKDLEGAMNRLFDAGEIEVGEVGQSTSRHPIKGIRRVRSGALGSSVSD